VGIFSFKIMSEKSSFFLLELCVGFNLDTEGGWHWCRWAFYFVVVVVIVPVSLSQLRPVKLAEE